MHLCNPVRPNRSHALQTHNIPWHYGLTWPIPFILIPWRRCVKHGRVQWLGVLDVNVACGPKRKKCFPETYPEQSALSLQRLQRQSCKGGNQNTACYAVTLPAPSFTHLILSTTGTTRSQWTDSERTLNVHWTCSERGIEHWENWGKDKSVEIERKFNICVFFWKSPSTAQICCYLQLFGLCSMCVQCYVHCMFTVCSMSASVAGALRLNLTRDHAPV